MRAVASLFPQLIVNGAMNRIKTDLRSSLKTSTLEKLMFIFLKGPGRSEFDFAAASNQWAVLQEQAHIFKLSLHVDSIITEIKVIIMPCM